jgi:hypothetical protein
MFLIVDDIDETFREIDRKYWTVSSIRLNLMQAIDGG